MTSAIDLDFIREAADKKYGAFEVNVGDGTPVVLTNPLRLSKPKREALSELKMEDYEDAVDYFEAAFVIASSKADAKRLREALGEDDITLYATVFELYTKGVELGEASPSQD